MSTITNLMEGAMHHAHHVVDTPVVQEASSHGGGGGGGGSHSADVFDCIASGTHGLMWAAFFAFLIPAVIIYILTEVYKRGNRLLHYFAFFITGVSALSYLSLLNYHGIYLSHDERCVFFTPYLERAINIPLMITAIGLYSGAQTSELLFQAASAFLFVVSAYLGSAHDGSNKWLYFCMALLFALPILRALLSEFRNYAGFADDQALSSRISLLSSITFAYLLFYLIMWLLNIGFYKVSDSTSLLWTTLLDLAFKFLFIGALLSSKDLIDRVGDKLGWSHTSIFEGSGSGVGSGLGRGSYGASDKSERSSLTGLAGAGRA